MADRRLMTVFDHVQVLGHDEDFHSRPGSPTAAPPGSLSKVEAMRQRALRGEDLFNADDGCCEGLDASQIAAFGLQVKGERKPREASHDRVPMQFANPHRVSRKTI